MLARSMLLRRAAASVVRPQATLTVRRGFASSAPFAAARRVATPRWKLLGATLAATGVTLAACEEAAFSEDIVEEEDGTICYIYMKDGVKMCAKYDKAGNLISDEPADAAAATEEEAGAPPNSAFVFVKPHAVTDATKALVAEQLEAKGIKITDNGSLTSEVIDDKKLIDQHYYAIASKATILTPDQLNVPEDKFKAQFGLEWKDALASGNVLNALDACKELGITATEMDKAWGKAKKAKKMIKFGGGFYCGLVEIEGKAPKYVFNGFFMEMRSKFTAPGGSINYYVVEWDEKSLAWGDFRGKVLGPTDPTEAPADSLRGMILKDWEALGLKSVPNVGDNGVHASASPFEALAERNNWLSVPIAKDPFGAALIAAGVPENVIADWSVDPQVMVDGKKGSLFDALEDLDSADCIAKCVAIAKENGVAA